MWPQAPGPQWYSYSSHGQQLIVQDWGIMAGHSIRGVMGRTGCRDQVEFGECLVVSTHWQIYRYLYFLWGITKNSRIKKNISYHTKEIKTIKIKSNSYFGLLAGWLTQAWYTNLRTNSRHKNRCLLYWRITWLPEICQNVIFRERLGPGREGLKTFNHLNSWQPCQCLSASITNPTFNKTCFSICALNTLWVKRGKAGDKAEITSRHNALEYWWGPPILHPGREQLKHTFTVRKPRLFLYIFVYIFTMTFA